MPRPLLERAMRGTLLWAARGGGAAEIHRPPGPVLPGGQTDRGRVPNSKRGRRCSENLGEPGELRVSLLDPDFHHPPRTQSGAPKASGEVFGVRSRRTRFRRNNLVPHRSLQAEQPGDDCELQLPAPRWPGARQLQGEVRRSTGSTGSVRESE